MSAIFAYFTIYLQDVFMCSDYYLNNFFMLLQTRLALHL